MCTGKPKTSFDLLFGNICLIVVVWNRTRVISKVHLYVKLNGKHIVHSCVYYMQSTVQGVRGKNK